MRGSLQSFKSQLHVSAGIPVTDLALSAPQEDAVKRQSQIDQLQREVQALKLAR